MSSRPAWTTGGDPNSKEIEMRKRTKEEWHESDNVVGTRKEKVFEITSALSSGYSILYGTATAQTSSCS